MEDKRRFPRLLTGWPLYFTISNNDKQVGYVKDISLKGVNLYFVDQNNMLSENHNFKIEIKTVDESLPSLVLTGLKKWYKNDVDENYIGLEFADIPEKKYEQLNLFLGHNSDIHVVVYIIGTD